MKNNLSALKSTTTPPRVAGLTLALTMGLFLNLPFGEVGGAYAQIAVTALPKTVAGGYNISCNNGSDGEVTTVVTGNTGPYTFSWGTSTPLSLTGATASSINSLIVGTYWVTVTDSLNNTATDTVTLIQPSVLGVSIDAHTFAGGTHISEHGAADGEMYSDVTGGIPPYQYDWNTGAHDEWTYKDVPAGTYTLIVTDAGGCQADADQTLTEPDVFSASVQAVERANGFHLTGCGDSDGEAEITATGGVAPYTFYWLSGETDAHAYYLGEGEQEATVIDANGVERQVTFELLRPERLAVEILTNDLYPNGYHTSCHNCSNATLTAQLTGGAEPFEYFWYREQQNGTAQLQNAGDPFYNLTVRDAMGCTGVAFAKLRIPQRDDWSVNGNPGLDINGNPKWLGTNDETDLLLKANNQPALRIGADGNVDVLGQLRIPSAAASSGAVLRVGINEWGEVAPMNPCGLFYPDGGGPGVGEVLNPDWASATNKIYVDYDCPVNVGIGTSNPQHRLEVSGNSMISRLGIGGTPGAGRDLHVHGSAELNRLMVGTYTPSAVAAIKGLSNSNVSTLEVFDSNDEVVFRILNDGRTIIGRPLQASGDEATIFLGDNNHYIRSTWGKGLSLGTFQADDALVIQQSSGNVGIGVDIEHDFEYKLEVCGTIRSKEMIVEVNQWCDYVFDPEYRLMPLPELEAFIAKHRHLPDVPTTAAVQENGVALGEMNAILLKKNEELTLYLLQLSKEVRELRGEVRQLKGR